MEGQSACKFYKLNLEGPKLTTSNTRRVGPCWPMYFVTFLLIAGGTAGVLGGLARDVIAVCVVGAILAVVTLTALTLTACRNPGIIERRQEQWDSTEIYDDRAMTYRPVGAMFEHETGTIIQDIDHFCPWTSTVYVFSLSNSTIK